MLETIILAVRRLLIHIDFKTTQIYAPLHASDDDIDRL